jgi:hypothetical protein
MKTTWLSMTMVKTGPATAPAAKSLAPALGIPRIGYFDLCGNHNQSGDDLDDYFKKPQEKAAGIAHCGSPVRKLNVQENLPSPGEKSLRARFGRRKYKSAVPMREQISCCCLATESRIGRGAIFAVPMWSGRGRRWRQTAARDRAVRMAGLRGASANPARLRRR